ncbi:MAG: carbohydrate ABC transporter permease [Eubacteriales bacterium]|nr:carbohydrate ABC transporter permease [Eubacteriales bacterium]
MLTKRQKSFRLLTILVLLALLAITLIPIYWSVVMSIDRTVLTEVPMPPRLFPKEFSLRSYEYAFKTLPLVRYFSNTLFLTVVNTSICVFFALCCGYAFAKGKFWLTNFWFLSMLAVMMIPFESIMVPLFLQYRNWGLLDTYWPLILGSFAYVFGAFLARQNMSALPDALREAAFLDGASEWRIFFTIIIPLSGPTIATLCILQAIGQWNNFLWPLIVISSREKHVISVGVSMFNANQSTMYLGPRMAVAFISTLPLMIMFLFLQKYIVASIALSGIKQ